MSEALRRLREEGYCLLEDRLDGDAAAALDARARARMDPAGGYVNLEGALNEIPELAQLCADAAVLDVVRGLAGDEVHVANNVCMKWCQPGVAAGGLHADWPLNGLATPWPAFPMLVQTMWMLTDFTADNGATRVVPGSHRSGEPPPQADSADEIAVTGRRGSVLVWHGALWHRQGANTSADRHRMGANVAYIPWYVHRPAAAWPLVRRDVYERLPPAAQALLGRSTAA